MKKILLAVAALSLFAIYSCRENKETEMPEPGTMDAESAVDVRATKLDTVNTVTDSTANMHTMP
jgi:nitrous oxide reductase accessory protein NosL